MTTFCFQGNAQINPCSTSDRMYGTMPSPAELKLKQQIDQKIRVLAGQKSGHELLIIPVVVHVIHMGTIGNISDAQVIDGLRVVNEDFNRLNADSVNTNPYFQPFAADVNIEFRLATLDPSGNLTTGIVRVDTNIIPHPEPTDPDFDNIKYASHWPEDMYFNIWTTRAIQGGSLGYAQYPGTAFTYGGPWHTWGPIVKSNQWGTIETSSVNGRTVTHELGHCFGLYHTFLSSAAGCGAQCDTTGDEVCDTPPCLLDWSCTVGNACANDTTGPSPFLVDSIDQMENYMSYNSCQNMFSKGQKDRMRGFYYQFDTINNLSLTSNLIATGTLFLANLASEETYEADIVIYPNPGNGVFTLSLPAHLPDGQFSVYDRMGKLVKFGRTTTSKSSIDLQGFTSGLYHLHLSVDGYSFHRKIIVTN
jgi:hypothetical protein